MKQMLFILILVSIFVVIPIASAAEFTNYTTPVNDGYSHRTSINLTWVDVRNGAGTDFDNTSVMLLTDITADSMSNRFAYLHRSHMIFDTAAIPDSAVITAASVTLTTMDASVLLGDMGVGLTKFTIDGLISADDYDNCGSALETQYRNISTIIGTTNIWSLNAAGLANISKTSTTGYCIRLEPDINNRTVWSLGARTYFEIGRAHV